MAITGLPRNDQIVRYIVSTFQILQHYARSARDDQRNAESTEISSSDRTQTLRAEPDHHRVPSSLRLVYNINVVFPETTNIEVYKFNIRKLTWEFASMISHRAVELFLLKCAVIETGLRASLAEYNESPPESLDLRSLSEISWSHI